MSESFAVTLSPDFERARKLSRIMAVLFTIAFWLTLAATILALAIPLDPIIERGGHGGVGHGTIGFDTLTLSLEGLSVSQCLLVMLAFEITILPLVFLMHHARRLFSHFARGEVFAVAAITHIQAAGLWLIVSFFSPIAGGILLLAGGMAAGQPIGPGLWPLGTGVVTFIAAHVMAEARRIADDNAGII
jgi:hypothetical protein